METPPGESVVMNGDHGGVVAAKKPQPGKKMAVEKVYQKITQVEHVLLRPDTYIGGVDSIKETMWVYNEEGGRIERREIIYVPGLYKIFDEILVNAADNKQRDQRMDCIKIDIDPEKNFISVWNNGKGIPVVEHKDEKMFVPTMIFGHLLTSSNYNDDEARVTGGRNGFGAKLCNIFSTQFTVETASKEFKKYFKQTWYGNMGKASEVKLVDYHKDDFTRVAFTPDLKRFQMETLDKDIVSLMARRALDVAACTHGVTVYLNGKKLPVKTFKSYVDLYLKDKTEKNSEKAVKCVHEIVNDRWEVAVALSTEGHQQVSFVNNIATTKGGRHVDHVLDIVMKPLSEAIKKKNKGGAVMKSAHVKLSIWIFVNCLIENPTFSSQTKEYMTLQPKQFGSKCNLSDKFHSLVSKSGIVEAVLYHAKEQADTQLSKCSGKKQNKLKGILKLEDANDAGSRNSLDCTLILTEGDSAKTVAVTGLAVVGRDKYGVFPLRGKLLNVREATHKQIIENQEINNIMKIMGLQYKKVYESINDLKTLRYGKMMIMTDQDQDGSHIKGLLINFIHHNWPSLLRLPFLEEFITPIVKATKGSTQMRFYSLPEFEDWKRDTENWYTFKIKYYKGLGTSTAEEAREYFADMGRHRVLFNHGGPQDDHSIIMAFSKKCVDQRKEWLTTWMEDTKRRRELGLTATFLYQTNTKIVTFSDFVNKELVLFSNLDNERSLPCLVDGLKPGQRKVVFTCIKRNDKREIKVAQLAGSVAEHSAYHHGEVSLMSTIINLAQNFVGSNNINILQPIGQFGSRLQGGKDAASPRYIFTMLSPLAKHIFHPHDAALLNYLQEDNQKIEPAYYVPVIPMMLVNGADGIGTGWMTKIPNYNPREIIDNIKRLLDGEETERMKPWYKNFRGTVTEIAHQRVLLSGEISMLGPTSFEITELPIGTWTQAYKEAVLEPMLHGAAEKKTPPFINDYKEYNSDTTVRFVIHMAEDKLAKAEEEGLHKVFKLQTIQNLTSMVCFDAMGCLKKYETVEEILKEYFAVRLKFYEKRKSYLEGILQAEVSKLSNQARFICEKCDGTLVIENKKRKAMIDELIKKGYDSDPVKAFKLKQNKDDVLQQIVESADVSQEEAEPDEGVDYDYLLGMTMWSLTKERKDELLKKQDEKQQEYRILQATSPSQIWRNDLDELLGALENLEAKEIAAAQVDSMKNLKGLKGKPAGKRKRGALAIETMPSPIGRKLAPRIGEELLKKVEKAVWAKENKGKRMPKVKREKEEEKDEFDLMCDGKTPNLAQRVGNSPEAVESKLKAKKAIKQTKLNFTKKSKKMDSDEDSDSFNEDVDFGGEEVAVRGVPKRAAATKAKLTYDDDEEAIFSSDSEKWGGGQVSDAHISVSDSDSEFEVTKKKNAKTTKALPESRNSDSLFDSLVGSSPEKLMAPPASVPSLPVVSEFTSASVSNGTNKRSFTDSSDEDSAPTKAPPKKKPAAPRVPKEPKEPKPPKAKPAKKAAAKKRSMDSDSDEEFELSKPTKAKGKAKMNDDDDYVDSGEDDYAPPPPPKTTAGRARKPVKYALSSDDDSD